MPYFIPSVTVVDPGGAHHEQQVALRIDGTRIAAVAPAGGLTAAAGDERLDLPDTARVSPGWIDLQAHLQDPGHEHKETLTALARAAVLGGFTDLLCYPETDPPLDRAQLIEGLLRRTEGLPTRLHLLGCLTEGGAGHELAELVDMHRVGAVAFTDGLTRPHDSGVLLRCLRYLSSFGGLMLLSPLETRLVPDGQMNESPQAVRLGMRGIPEVAESMTVAQELELLAYQPGRVHYQPLTSPRALAQVVALRQAVGAQGAPTVGVPLPYLLHDDTELAAFDTTFKLMPPLRSPAQREALRAALKRGEIDLVTSGHLAQGREEKDLEFALAEPGMLTLPTFYPMALTLVRDGLLDESGLIRLLTQRPREVLGWPELHLAAGAEARLTFFDPSATWVLHQQALPSRAKNSPYLGRTLQGRVLGTVLGGRWQGVG